MSYSLEQIRALQRPALNELAQRLGMKGFRNYKKQELVEQLVQQLGLEVVSQGAAAPAPGLGPMAQGSGAPARAAEAAAPAAEVPAKAKGKKPQPFAGLELHLPVSGVLELVPEGYGFLRSPHYGYLTSLDDVYVSAHLVRSMGLKTGDTLQGLLRPPRMGDKFFGLLRLDQVNGHPAQQVKDRIGFEYLTPLSPDSKLQITTSPTQYTTRIADLFAPIGKGQRGMIVAPPKSGKTFLLKDIANGIAKNHPEVYLIVLLIDERPEEVTDMARSVRAEVLASTFDKQPENHVKLAALVQEKAKRMVEAGHEVVIILDGITRLARAYNAVVRSSGKILSGGVEATALQRAKQFFGAARNVEGGGSLTILATALIDTGSRMDEVIFEEFKGTGNMELQLDRRLANKGIYPAIDIMRSSTRRDALLHSAEVVKRVHILRHAMAEMNAESALNFILKNMRGTKHNGAFLAAMHH